MAGEIEAFGQMATAGLAASTLDRLRARGAARLPARERRDPHDLAHGACANCDTDLTRAFCATCGQSAHVHRSIGHIFEEFLHGIWHFDSKAWKTLPRLVFAPGRLTRDYVYGKRAGYIAPLALFLFSIFLMFFVFETLGGPDINDALASAGGTPMVNAQSDFDDAKSEVADAQAEIADAKADTDTTPSDMAKLTTTLADNEAKLSMAAKALAVATAAQRTAPAPVKKTRWQDELAQEARAGKITVGFGGPVVEERVRTALQNPDFAIYKIQQKAYKLSFLLIPLSLPTLWLLFAFRRGVHTYDHVVFALYSLSFMSMLFVVIALIAKIDPTAGAHLSGATTGISGGIAGALIFAVPVHMFAQLKGAYRLGVGGALWRTAVLLLSSMVTLGIFAALIVVVGLAD